MSDELAIRVENLSKRYRIGGRNEPYGSLRESLARAAAAPFRRLQKGSSDGRDRAHETIWALKDVSFEVKRGEVMGIIGRNGAGKSTLLKILSRITRPTEGFVRVRGRVGSLLEVGTGFHPELTGRENIYLNGAVLGMKRVEIERKFDQIVDFAEIEAFLDTPVKHYSSGMYTRLAFAVAAHLEPEILLVDEVLAVGDAEFQRKCLGKMGEVAQKGRTVIFVSHNMLAVQNLCERVLWLKDGKIYSDGDANKITSDYIHISLSNWMIKQSWSDLAKAPGNHQARVRSISVHPVIDNGSLDLYQDQELAIETEFWSLKDNQDLAITLHLVTSSGITVLSTSTIHNDSIETRRLSKGLFKASCRIPANLLNCGIYRVRLLLVGNRSVVRFKMEQALVFEIIDSSNSRDGYFGKRPGVIAPILGWNFQCLDNSLP